MWQIIDIIDFTNCVLPVKPLRIESGSLKWFFGWLAKFVEVCVFCQSYNFSLCVCMFVLQFFNIGQK